MFGRRSTVVTGLIVAALTSLAGAGSEAAAANRPPDWQKALVARSRALDHRYRLDREAMELARRFDLGVPTRTTAGTGAPAWLKALIVRSDALDRAYGLGIYAARG